jgi:hypothetical protein
MWYQKHRVRRTKENGKLLSFFTDETGFQNVQNNGFTLTDNFMTTIQNLLADCTT